MKKICLAILVSIFALSTFANTKIEHKVRKPFEKYVLTRFTVCNEMTYPIYFTAWAIDRPKTYRWADWIQPGECRLDEFDKYYDSALYEFSVAPYESPFRDYVLSQGEKYVVSPFNKVAH